MKNSTSLLFLFYGLFLTLGQFSCTNSNEETYALLNDLLDSRRILLPNGWSLSVPGESIPLGDFPLNLVTSKDGQVMAVTNNGQSEQSIMLIDPQAFEIINKTEISKSWYGLAFNEDHSQLFASGGNDNMIRIYDTSDNQLTEVDSAVLGAAWPEKISPTGLTLDHKNENLYIVTKDDSALYKVNLLSLESERLFLGHEAFTCTFSRDESVLYVSLWGGNAIAVIDPESLSILNTIPVGSNPNDLVLTLDGKYLLPHVQMIIQYTL